MSNTTEQMKLGVNEEKTLAVDSKGAMGLQLNYRLSDNGIVDVRKGETDATMNNGAIGGAVKAMFVVKGLKAGKATVTFYSARSWDENFKEIIEREVAVEVG